MYTTLRKISVLFVLICGVTLYAVANDTKPCVATLPPVVVKTFPVSGDLHVDAAKTKEIRVTFSKDMLNKSWSWVQLNSESNPKIAGDIQYDVNKRTCIAPVELEPGHAYAIWLNNHQYQNFKDRDERAAVPYLLVFETEPK